MPDLIPESLIRDASHTRPSYQEGDVVERCDEDCYTAEGRVRYERYHVPGRVFIVTRINRDVDGAYFTSVSSTDGVVRVAEFFAARWRAVTPGVTRERTPIKTSNTKHKIGVPKGALP